MILNGCNGSLAVSLCRRLSTSAFAHKGGVQANGIIGLGTAAFGQKRSIEIYEVRPL